MIERIVTLRRAFVLVVVVSLLVPAALINGISWLNRYEKDVRISTRKLLEQNADLVSNGVRIRY
ncbi:MAG: domain S-box protein [Herminiimonas sp.]|nr:domain S-box protein [Herminiimonas sp.]